MDYKAAVDRLYALGAELHSAPGQPRRKFDLAQMRTLLAALGNPQQRFPSVLIAGTNGKGSTAATLASILAASGYRTGLYTSPHLERVNERIQLLFPRAVFSPEAGADVLPQSTVKQIGDTQFARLFSTVESTAVELTQKGELPSMASFFEVITAMGFLFFADAEVQIAVLEVGMGGRLDATNVVEPLLSIITDISLDHTDWLGSTIGEIAIEKAGILRPNGTMVTLPQHPEANQVLGERAVTLQVRGVNAADFLRSTHLSDLAGEQYEVVFNGDPILLDPPLRGKHQQRNLALALAAAQELCNYHGYNMQSSAVSTGVATTRWPGRLERICFHGKDLLLDVGHNPAGAWALRSAISGEPERPRTLIFSCLQDKPVVELAQILFPIFDHIILVQVDSPRAESAEHLAQAAAAVGTSYEVAPNLPAALEAACTHIHTDGEIVVTGSVFLVGSLRALVLNEEPLRA